MSVTLLDLTSKQKNPPSSGSEKHLLDRNGRVVVRDPRKVTGITLHQTACVFGKAPGDPDRYHRALNVGAHATAFGRDRVVVLANPLLHYVYHGNGFNSEDVGFETEGRFSGLLDDPKTIEREDLLTSWSGTMDRVTDADLETLFAGLKWVCEMARALGCDLRYLHAHRQSSPTRRSDPGEGLWRPAQEYAKRELGLTTQPGRRLQTKKGPGRPIPKEWDPVSGVGSY